jgi:hypothetical protein
MVVFWVVTPCGLVGGYQHFGGTYSLHLRGELKPEVIRSSKKLVTPYETTQHHNPEDHE